MLNYFQYKQLIKLIALALKTEKTLTKHLFCQSLYVLITIKANPYFISYTTPALFLHTLQLLLHREHGEYPLHGARQKY